MVLDRYFTFEPIAFAVHRNDDDFRLVVDTSLSTLYNSGGDKIAQIGRVILGKSLSSPGKLLWQVLKIWKHTLKALRSLPNYVISYRTGPNSKGSARWLPWIPAC